MKKRSPLVIILALALSVLAPACTIYKIKEMDAKTLAAKGKKGLILSVETGGEYVEFPDADPARLRGAGIAGRIYGSRDIDPYDIADIASAGPGARIVLRGGERLDVLSGFPTGEGTVRCEVAKPTYIPLDQVDKAKVRVVNTAASVLTTLGGITLLVGAIALDASTDDPDDIFEGATEDIVESFVFSMFETAVVGPPPGGRSLRLSLGPGGSRPAAEESQFWVLEWTPVDAEPGEDGRVHVRLGNRSGVPRGIDEAKLVAVDHPVGTEAAPDCRGFVRAVGDPVPPSSAVDGSGRDIAPLLRSRDDDLWRSRGGEAAQGAATGPRDELTLEFPRPPGARRAKLVVNAANSTWRALFAREAALVGQVSKDRRAAPGYHEREFSKLRVHVSTVFGWQTGQAICAAGPLPAESAIYEIDLEDVEGDRVRLRLEPPAGYWLIDRLALDYGPDLSLEEAVIDAEGADGPDGPGILRALAAEDGTTAVFEGSGAESLLTFAVPPPKEGTRRTLFLRTVSCYDMPLPPDAPPRPVRR